MVNKLNLTEFIDFESSVRSFYSGDLINNSGRYRSFDYCYNYFRSNIKNLDNDLEKSCLVLGFYLASWGMYRGSAKILQKSVVQYIPLVEYINGLNESYWEIDLDNYKGNIKKLSDLYEVIIEKLGKELNPSLTLVTKIMLGVFGCVPAFDTNFRKGISSQIDMKYGLSSLKKSLPLLREVYRANSEVINKLSEKFKTSDFGTCKDTGFHYTKAKILDMYGFMKGMEVIEKRKLDKEREKSSEKIV
ncbi:MAG: hypothetical protein P9M05_11635 [Candidatus Stygibacter australis]|nr:hypothetical protein [Candidatus Stygibacter australis]